MGGFAVPVQALLRRIGVWSLPLSSWLLFPRLPQACLLVPQCKRGTACRFCRLDPQWLDEVSWASCRSALHTSWAWFPLACMEELFGVSCLPPLEAHSCSVVRSSLPKPRKPRRESQPSLRVPPLTWKPCGADRTVRN